MSIVEKTFKNGEVIIKEGDIGKSFFQLVDGNAYVYAGYGKNDQVQLSVLNAGEFFGEMAILEAYPRSATIVARGTVTAIEIPEGDMNSFFKENPDMILELMKHLGSRVQAMTKDYNDAQALLKQVRESEDAKKNKSLFSKIKKHIDVYQSNKNKIEVPDTDPLREALKDSTDKGSGEIKDYLKGRIIFKEGTPGECMYILHRGTVGMYSDFRKREEVKLIDINAISIFGEMGIIASGEPRVATAVSETNDTKVEIIYPDDLVKIFNECPAKIDAILRHLSYRLRKINKEFLNTCKEITESYNGK